MKREDKIFKVVAFCIIAAAILYCLVYFFIWLFTM